MYSYRMSDLRYSSLFSDAGGGAPSHSTGARGQLRPLSQGPRSIRRSTPRVAVSAGVEDCDWSRRTAAVSSVLLQGQSKNLTRRSTPIFHCVTIFLYAALCRVFNGHVIKHCDVSPTVAFCVKLSWYRDAAVT